MKMMQKQNLSVEKSEKEVAFRGETMPEKASFFKRFGIYNRKGATTLSAWTEIAIIMIIVTTTFSLITVMMNTTYHVDASETPNVFSEGTSNFLSKYLNTSIAGKSSISSGEVSFNSFFGFNWQGAWDLSRTLGLIAWDIISGNWIRNILTAIFWGFGGIEIIASIVQILFEIGIIYAFISLVTKIRNP